MEATRIATATGDTTSDFEIETIADPHALDEVLRLRYRVYCDECQFEPGCDGRETDQFDAMSRHILLRHRHTRKAVGTVRLVIPRLHGPGAAMPIEQFVNATRLRALPRSGIAEVSRFALTRELRTASAIQGTFARLSLIRGIVQLSSEMRLTHWCALIEPRLLRLLAQSAIHFMPIGGLVDHRGLRQPSMLCVSEMLARMRRERPAVWDFVSNSGAFWPRAVSGDAA